MNATYYFSITPRVIFELNQEAIIVLWNDICPESRIPDYFDRYGIKYKRQCNLQDTISSIPFRYLATVYVVEDRVTYTETDLYVLARDVLTEFMNQGVARYGEHF